MFLSLSFKNIFRNSSRSFIVILTFIIGSFTLCLFSGIWIGVDQWINNNTNSENLVLQVRPDVPPFWLNLATQNKPNFSSQEIQEIEEIEGVTLVIPESVLRRPATAEIELNIGPWKGLFEIDTLVFGTEGILFEDIENNTEIFTDENSYVPVIISKNILRIYNFLIAEQNGLPTFSPEDFINKEFNLYKNYSSFLKWGEKKDPIKCKIIGFSNKAELTGITVPIEYLEKWKKSDSNPNLLYLKIENQNYSNSVEKELASKNYRVEKNNDLFATMYKINFYFGVILLSLTILIWITVIISLFSTFSANLIERKKEIRTWQIIGANNFQIFKLFILENIFLAITGTTIGIILANLLGTLINQNLNIFGLENNFKIFICSWWLVIFIFIFNIVVCKINIGIILFSLTKKRYK